MSHIRAVEVIPAAIPFKADFVIGRGAVGAAGGAGAHVFVRLESDCGQVGWGEVRALPAWSYETWESIASCISGYFGPILLGRSPFSLLSLQQEMGERVTAAVSNGQPFARAAVDMALHDLAGRIAGVPVHALLGGKTRDAVPLCYAISIAEPAAMAAQAAASPECHCFKIKVAGQPELDAERVKAVSAARPDATLWLDANQAYHVASLVAFLDAVREVPRLFCLEQPVRSVDWFGMRAARERSFLPIAIDEGCFSIHDVARMAEFRAADLLVLKVCKSGGLRECARSAAVAESHGLGLLGSGLTESGVGLAASVHLFSTLPTLLPPELNGVQFLQEMYVSGLQIQGASVTVPDGPGLGVDVDEARLRALPTP